MHTEWAGQLLAGVRSSFAFRFPSGGVIADLAIDTFDIHNHHNLALQVLGLLFKAGNP